MIDFIKIKVINYPIDKILSNPILEFTRDININTGQTLSNFNLANYKGIKFKVYDSGSMYVSGSLHKFWNDGYHNYNDFNINAIKCVLNDFYQLFEIEPNQCILKCLEIGINIVPPIKTNQLLSKCLLHKTKHLEYKFHNDEGRYKQCEHAQYIVKIYNKALHYQKQGYDINTELLRLEIKYTRMKKLNDLNIYTLQDLLDYGLTNFKNELLLMWNDILFYDENNNLSEKKKLKYKNSEYWLELQENNQKPLFNKNRKELNNSLSKTDNLKTQMIEIISNKVDELNL